MHLLWKYPVPLLKVAAQTYLKAVAARREGHRNRWHTLARSVDYRFLSVALPMYASVCKKDHTAAVPIWHLMVDFGCGT